MPLLVIDNGYDPDSPTSGAMRSEVSSRVNSTKTIPAAALSLWRRFPVRQHFRILLSFVAIFLCEGSAEHKKNPS